MATQLLMRKPIIIMSALGTAMGSAVLSKELFGAPKYKGRDDIKGKNVVVTGANSGLGFEVSKNLAKRGAHVIMACRDLQKCERARNKIVHNCPSSDVTCAVLDLASLQSVREFSNELIKKYENIDILVNNAAVMDVSKKTTKEGFELHLGVNHLGPFLLTQLLSNHITGRIVNVTSNSHKNGKIDFEDFNMENDFNAKGAYDRSKLANVLHMKELSERLKDRNVIACAINPGNVCTNLTRHMVEQRDWLSAKSYKFFLWFAFLSPEGGSQSIIRCCLAPDIKNGAYYSKEEDESEPSEQTQDKILVKQLWATSQKWTSLVNENVQQL